ncbi:hypothetical protein MY8738_000516 [Beauveria namnaoensis]
MPVIAHAAPHIGLEPSHSRHAPSDLAAHVFATISRASSIADTHQSTVMSSRLSLKGLLQSENVQIIQQNLAVLARFADDLPRDIDSETPRVTNDELLIMGNLVRDITSSLDKIESLRADENENEMLPHVADKYVPTRPISSAARARRKEQNKQRMTHKCHNCHRVETPQWRPGPDGPKTLCNVCGLVYTKRQQKRPTK